MGVGRNAPRGHRGPADATREHAPTVSPPWWVQSSRHVRHRALPTAVPHRGLLPSRSSSSRRQDGASAAGDRGRRASSRHQIRQGQSGGLRCPGREDRTPMMLRDRGAYGPRSHGALGPRPGRAAPGSPSLRRLRRPAQRIGRSSTAAGQLCGRARRPLPFQGQHGSPPWRRDRTPRAVCPSAQRRLLSRPRPTEPQTRTSARAQEPRARCQKRLVGMTAGQHLPNARTSCLPSVSPMRSAPRAASIGRIQQPAVQSHVPTRSPTSAHAQPATAQELRGEVSPQGDRWSTQWAPKCPET
ncbi:hypothetical protein EV284_4196 [Streptomyces sp. BK022]|nr:hypothetical protein EV284_4196 [Streptomyces sp. BK022]